MIVKKCHLVLFGLVAIFVLAGCGAASEPAQTAHQAAESAQVTTPIIEAAAVAVPPTNTPKPKSTPTPKPTDAPTPTPFPTLNPSLTITELDSASVRFSVEDQTTRLFSFDYLGATHFTATLSNSKGDSLILASCPTACHQEEPIDLYGGNYLLEVKTTGTWSVIVTESNGDTVALASPAPSIPSIEAEKDVNLRAGPGTSYPIVGGLSAGQSYEITGRNADSSWWQVSTENGPAWVAASVVKASNTDQTIEVADAPPLPATETPVPTIAPTEAPTPTVAAVAQPTAAPASDHPSDATAKCGDGSFSYAASHRGACSHHGGVAVWYK